MGRSLYQKVRWQFILFLARRLPDCKTVTPTLGESLDRALSLRERIVARLHLFTCEACQRYLVQIKFLREAMKKHNEMLAVGTENSSVSMRTEAKERLKKELSSTMSL